MTQEELTKTNWKKFSKMADLYMAAKERGDHKLTNKLSETLIWALKNGVYWELSEEFFNLN